MFKKNRFRIIEYTQGNGQHYYKIERYWDFMVGWLEIPTVFLSFEDAHEAVLIRLEEIQNRLVTQKEIARYGDPNYLDYTHAKFIPKSNNKSKKKNQ